MDVAHVSTVEALDRAIRRTPAGLSLECSDMLMHKGILCKCWSRDMLQGLEGCTSVFGKDMLSGFGWLGGYTSIGCRYWFIDIDSLAVWLFPRSNWIMIDGLSWLQRGRFKMILREPGCLDAKVVCSSYLTGLLVLSTLHRITSRVTLLWGLSSSSKEPFWKAQFPLRKGVLRRLTARNWIWGWLPSFSTVLCLAYVCFCGVWGRVSFNLRDS